MSLEENFEREQLKRRSIQKIAQAVASTLELDRLLQMIMSKITELMDADRSTLYVMNEAGTELWTKVLQADELREIRLDVGQGIAGWVAQTGEVVNIADAYQDDRFNPEVDRKTGYRTKSILCVPMKDNRGRITGVVQVLNKAGPAFSVEDVNLLVALTTQASIAIENSKLYEFVKEQNIQLLDTQQKLERRAKELDLLLEVQQQINEAESLDALLDGLLSRTTELIGAEASSILFNDLNTHRLYFRSTTGDKREIIKRESVNLGEGICGWVAQHGEPQLINDPGNDPRHLKDLALKVGFTPRNILCVPLEGTGSVLGAIELLNKLGGDAFDEEDQTLLTLVAGRIANTIELARAKDEQAKQSRLASIGQMLSGVIHDLKTPMTIISGYAQLMAQQEDKEARQQFVEQILKQFEVMAAMSKEVLAFARGQTHLLIRKVYLHKFLAEMREHLEHEFKGKGIELEIDLRFLGVAYLDEAKMRRVFHNIGRNAADAMPEGGRFLITVEEVGDELSITFADTGTGVPTELEGHLFELFATAGKEEGTGLGLALVHKIIKQHRGDIGYQSSAKGTTFTVNLPLERVVTGGGEATPSAPAGP